MIRTDGPTDPQSVAPAALRVESGHATGATGAPARVSGQQLMTGAHAPVETV